MKTLLLKEGGSWTDQDSGESLDGSDIEELLGRLPEGSKLIVEADEDDEDDS